MMRALIWALIGLGCLGGFLGWSADALANLLCRPLEEKAIPFTEIDIQQLICDFVTH